MPSRKILIVDGDVASRNYVRSTLQHQGYEILAAASGKEGLVAAWRDHPDLIIADPVEADLAGEDLAVRLRSDERTIRVPLIALSSDVRAARRQECLQAGFDDYLVKSPAVVPSLLESLSRFLNRPMPLAAQGGLTMAFLSAKGGTGTSSLCANLAMTMAEDHPQERVAVADLVLPIGSIAGIVGYDGAESLLQLAHLPASESIPEFLNAHLSPLERWGFRLVAGSPDPEGANDLDVRRINDIVAALRTAYDFVLLDLGRALSRISLPLILSADVVVMITGADISTVTLTKTVWGYLRGKGVRPASVYLILNRSVGLEGLAKPEIENIIGLPIQAAMPYLGSNVSVANNQHHPYVLNFPADTASIILKDAARQMAVLARNMRSA